MTTRLNPYLGFDGTAREAMEFYRSVFGGELSLSTFAELGMSEDPADRDRVMHGMLETPSGLVLMGADSPSAVEAAPGSSISVSLSGDAEDESEMTGWWERLCDGGTVTVPLEKAPWGDLFGMCTDRHGTAWMVDVAGAGS